MKPRNFPGRKHARRVRVGLRARGERLTEWRNGQRIRCTTAHPTVADIRWRIGGKNRDALTGIAINRSPDKV